MIVSYMVFQLSSDNITGFDGDTAKSSFFFESVLSLHPYIALFSPVFTPGIFNKPVVLTIFISITDSKHTMVLISATITIAKDTLLIKMEYRAVTDANGDRLLR